MRRDSSLETISFKGAAALMRPRRDEKSVVLVVVA
jgi:hypothetical protein